VIINVHTELLTTLAAHSARRFGAGEILLVDCDPTPASQAKMEALAQAVRATTIPAPVRPHGQMLDTLFTHLSDDRILLLDSDAELRSDVLDRMRQDIVPADVYGSGWLHESSWMVGVLGIASRPSIRTGWYLTRPWIPCVLLKRGMVADAIRSGATFRKKIIPNDLRVPGLRHILFLRFGLPGLRRLRFSRLRWLRKDYDGQRPNYCYADTGAQLHAWLSASGLRFAGPPAFHEDMEAEIAHFDGATRARLSRGRDARVSLSSFQDEARERLRSQYEVHA
jgi:hypothetical protein